MSVRARFAPSPTGYLHVGGARTALFSWAYARRHAGAFILRIEDTDLQRSTPEAVTAILDAMAWLGLDYDEGPYFQMQRMDRYRSVLAEMVERGLAYRCYMAPAELDAWAADFAHYRAGLTGESTAQFVARVGRLLDESRAAGGDQVWIAHGGVFKAMLAHQGGVGVAAMSDWPRQSLAWGECHLFHIKG